MKILCGQLTFPIIDRHQRRAERIALIRHRLDGFELRQVAREEPTPQTSRGRARDAADEFILDSAGE